MLVSDVQIEEVKSIEQHQEKLSELLIRVVDDGASIGFLPPMDHSVATDYWGSVLQSDVILFIAKIDDEVVGTVQLHLCAKQNGSHRAEIAKLMSHPDFRRHGIGRSLMKTAEERAKKEGRTLLVLDTREGDTSNLLYASLGFVEAGRIPNYARSANGQLDESVFYYKTF